MKKLLAILILFFLSSNLFAQSPLSKGVYSVSGSISYSNTSNGSNSDSQSYLTLTPSVGYFFLDNFYTALSINYEYLSYQNSSRESYGFGPTLRYYFDANRTLKPFAGLAYHYSYLNKDISSNNFTISGGADLFLTNAFAIEGSINYSFQNYIASDGYFSGDGKSKTFNINIGVNYFIH